MSCIQSYYKYKLLLTIVLQFNVLRLSCNSMSCDCLAIVLRLSCNFTCITIVLQHHLGSEHCPFTSTLLKYESFFYCFIAPRPSKMGSTSKRFCPLHPQHNLRHPETRPGMTTTWGWWVSLIIEEFSGAIKCVSGATQHRRCHQNSVVNNYIVWIRYLPQWYWSRLPMYNELHD